MILSIAMIWVRNNTYKHTHTRGHTKKVKKAKNIRVKKQRKARKVISIFQQELA